MNLSLHCWDTEQKELLSFCCNEHFSNLAVSLSSLHFSSCLSEVRGLDQETAFHLICITSCLAARKHAWLLIIHQAIRSAQGLQPVVIYHLTNLFSSSALTGHFSLQMNWARWSVREGQLEYMQQGVGGIVTNNIFKPYTLAAVQKVKKILSAFRKALFSLSHFLHSSQKTLFFLNPVSF